MYDITYETINDISRRLEGVLPAELNACDPFHAGNEDVQVTIIPPTPGLKAHRLVVTIPHKGVNVEFAAIVWLAQPLGQNAFRFTNVGVLTAEQTVTFEVPIESRYSLCVVENSRDCRCSLQCPGMANPVTVEETLSGYNVVSGEFSMIGEATEQNESRFAIELCDLRPDDKSIRAGIKNGTQPSISPHYRGYHGLNKAGMLASGQRGDESDATQPRIPIPFIGLEDGFFVVRLRVDHGRFPNARATVSFVDTRTRSLLHQEEIQFEDLRTSLRDDAIQYFESRTALADLPGNVVSKLRDDEIDAYPFPN